MVGIVASTNSSGTVISNNETVSTMVKSGGGDDIFLYTHYDRISNTAPQNTVSAATIGGTNLTEDAYVFFDNVGTQDLYVGDYYVTDANIPTSANPTLSKTNSGGVVGVGAYFHLSGVDQTTPLRTAHANAYQAIVDSASSRQYTGETGDLVYYIVSLNTPNGGMNVPAGFTELMSTTAGDHGDTLLDIFAVYYKVLTADETDASIALPMNATGTFRGWHWARVVKAAAGGLVSVNTDYVNQLNFLQNVNSDYVAQLDLLQNVTTDYVVRNDLLTGVQTDYNMLVDMIGLIGADYTIQLDLVNLIQTDYVAAIDLLQTVQTDYVGNLDFLAGLITDYVNRLDLLQRVESDYINRLDLLQITSADYDILANFLATGSVATDFNLIINLLQSVNSDYTINTDLLQSVNTDYATVIRLLQGVSKDQDLVLDFLENVSGDYVVNLNMLVGNQIATDYNIVVNLREKLETAFDARLDFLRVETGDYNIVSNLLDAITKDFVSQFELLAGVETNYVISLDAIGRVNNTYDILISFGDQNLTPAHYLIDISPEVLDFKQTETTIIKFNDEDTETFII